MEGTKIDLKPPRCVHERVRIAMGYVLATLGGCAPSLRDQERWAIGCGSSGTGLAAPGAEGTLGTGASGVFACRGATLGVGVGVGGAVGAGAGRCWLRALRRVGAGVGAGCGAVVVVGGMAHQQKASRRRLMASIWALWFVMGASWRAEVSNMIPCWRRSSGVTSGTIMCWWRNEIVSVIRSHLCPLPLYAT